MTNRRILFYTLLDLVVWLLVFWLVTGDSKRERARFWFYVLRYSRRLATAAGTVAIRAEHCYYLAVTSL